jgi:hypothetical protein
VTAKLTAIPANRSDETRTQANKKVCPIEHRSAASAAKGATMDGEIGPKRPLLEFEIRLVANVLEADWNARLRELAQEHVGGRAAK